jgi:hypothetical protein
MLTGLPPYYDTNVQRMYHKILHEPLRFPKGERYASKCMSKYSLEFFSLHFDLIFVFMNYANLTEFIEFM